MVTKITDTLISWASDLDDGARAQALRTSRLAVLAGPVALMPDAHFGMGATIGSVVPTAGALLPAAVGVDIGCGMIAAETNLVAGDLPDDLARLHGLLRDRIPAGVGRGHARGEGAEPEALRALGLPPGSASRLSSNQRTKIAAQFGSLGSGNHFVELCLDERDRVWLVLHSGSRGIGNQLATAHIKVAQQVAKEEGQVLEDRDLAWLAEGRPEFDAYVADLLWCQAYALANREQMMDTALAAAAQGGPQGADRRADQLPPQLRQPGDPPGPRGLDHPQGRHPGRPRRPRGHPGFDGHVVVHRPGRGQPSCRTSRARTAPAAGWAGARPAGA